MPKPPQGPSIEGGRADAAHLRKVFDAIDDAIVLLDQALLVTDCNRTAAAMLGARKGMPFSSLIVDFLSMEWRKMDSTDSPLAYARKKRKSAHFRGYAALAHKKFMPIALSVIPFPPGFLVLVRDISRDIAVEKELRDFVGIASHQLRTPLSSILWFLELLLAGDAGEVNKRQWELLMQSYNAAARLADMIRLLLDVSRIELGAVAITPEPQDLVARVRQEVAQLKIFIGKKQQTVEVRLPAVPVVVPLDRTVFGFVFQNLLSNAIKYTQQGGALTVSLKEDKDAYVVSIADSGYGIPKEAQPHIFQKFFRAENILTFSPEGTGLGLYIAKSLVTLWGGRIWFSSEEGKGTTFFFTVPKTGFRHIRGRTTVERTQIPLY